MIKHKIGKFSSLAENKLKLINIFINAYASNEEQKIYHELPDIAFSAIVSVAMCGQNSI